MSECTLGVTWWDGPEPTPGVYFKTVRGRTAYEVLAFKRRRPGSKTYGTIRCRRLTPAEIPEGATVFAWVWSHRG